MTDDDLDRRLRQALSVAPGADLAARIRRRIADEPDRSSGAWRWVPATLGGLVVAGALLVLSSGRPNPVGESPPTPGTAARVEAVPSRDWPARIVMPSRDETDTRPTRPRAATMPPASPAMQLAPGDAEAFRVLLAFSRTTVAAEPSDVILPAELSALQPLDIAPIAIAPLVVADVIEGGLQ